MAPHPNRKIFCTSKMREGIVLALTLAIVTAGVPVLAGPINEQVSVSSPLPMDVVLALIDAESNASEPAVMQIGPIPSGSPDEGTCGNYWAQDTFTRYFTVKQTGPTTVRVFEKVKDGSFVTNAGPSPGACDSTDGTPPGALIQGITGTMQGYLITDVTCDPVAGCPSNPSCGVDNSLCQTTNGFIQTFFGINASRNDVAYFFHYAGTDGSNKVLLEHEWKNASPNRGGNHGDIASCYVPVAGLSCF